jgi:hypothetical protein
VCAGRTGNAGNPCEGYCSGALILPNVVVTARHCVSETTKLIDCSTNPQFGTSKQGMWITTNNEMLRNATKGWHQVKTVLMPQDDHVCGHDIALLVLSDTVAETEAKPAIPGVQYPMGDLSRYARRFTAIGYGNTSPQGFTAGTRRILNNVSVLCIPGDKLAPCPKDSGIDDAEFVGSDGTCEGDSGSSAFEHNSFLKGDPVSLGVLSRGGESADGQTCKGSLYTRLDKWRDFIVQGAETASNNWTLYPKPVPDWTVYVPPPPDAGAPEAGPTKPAKPTNLAEGAACADDAECTSKICADTGSGKTCTVGCDESAVPTECRYGFVCQDSICVQDLGGSSSSAAAAATPQTTTTTTGCAVATRGAGGDGRGGAPLGALGIVVAAALGLGLRRRDRASTN